MRFLLLVFALLVIVQAAPIPSGRPVKRKDNEVAVSTLSLQTVNAFHPQALLAQAAYCDDAAAALPQLNMLLTGGDGGSVPRFYVAEDTTSQSLIVAHEGTVSDNPLSIINDAEFLKSPLDQTFFPGVNSEIEVHSGFGKTFARTADQILSAVQSGLAANPDITKITISGHSLGAALSVMTSVFLQMQINGAGPDGLAKRSSPLEIETVVFGLPRGGNQEWADFVDLMLPGLVHMHNKNDIVPTVPPRAIGYQQPGGEIFIQPSDAVVSCPGQENENCSQGNSLLDVSIQDHKGPYIGEMMGRKACPVKTALSAV